MKVVILAGGLGTRLQEETVARPKPMVEIGGRPILWHIMHIYAAHGFREFVVALGYKAEVVRSYFLHYHYLGRDFSINLADGATAMHGPGTECTRGARPRPWAGCVACGAGWATSPS